MHLAQGAGPGSEVLGKGEHRPAVHPAKPGDDPVRGDLHLLHAEIDAAVFDKNIGFPESPGIKKEVKALPGGEFPGLVLLVHRLGAAHGLDLVFTFLQFLKLFSRSFHG